MDEPKQTISNNCLRVILRSIVLPVFILMLSISNPSSTASGGSKGNCWLGNGGRLILLGKGGKPVSGATIGVAGMTLGAGFSVFGRWKTILIFVILPMLLINSLNDQPCTFISLIAVSLRDFLILSLVIDFKFKVC